MAPQTRSRLSVKADCVYILTEGPHIEYEWTIKNFKFRPEENGHNIYSPIFPVNNNDEQWRLSLYPQGCNKGDSEWISLYLHPVLGKMTGIRVKYELFLMRSKQVFGRKLCFHTYETGTGNGYHHFVKRSSLFTMNDPDDAITVCCKIDVLVNHKALSSTSKSAKEAISFKSEADRRNSDFRPFYNNSKLSDFTVISGGESFPAHKIVLANHSTVFAAMFENETMDENVQNEVKIDNMDAAVVKGMLEFMYTGNVSLIGVLARGLLAAAEQYALTGLKSLCEETLYDKLDEDNAAETLVLADLHRADQLKRCVMQYIVDHRSDIVKSESFKMAEIPSSLAKEVITALSV